MSTLTGRKPKDTYPWLLQAGAGGALTGTPRAICLGDGSATPLSLTSTGILMNGLVVAIDSAVVHNTGTETIAGAKSFSGQMELTGQAATNATSAMTRALGDARYYMHPLVAATFIEDFMGGEGVSGYFGSMGWRTASITGTASFSYTASEANHPGIVSVVTAATASCTGVFYASGNGANFGCVAQLDSGDWEMAFVFNPSSVAGVRIYIGVTGEFNTTVLPGSRGVVLRYDTSLSDTTWKLEVRNASSSTVQDSGVTATTGWHKAEISCVSGTVKMRIDGGTWTAGASTNKPEGYLYPTIKLGNDGSTAKTLLVDLYALIHKVTR